MKILIEVWITMMIAGFTMYGDTGVLVSTMMCGAAAPHILVSKK